MKFEALRASILKKYAGTIERVEIMYSCDFQELKRTTLKTFIENLPLPNRQRLIPETRCEGVVAILLSRLQTAQKNFSYSIKMPVSST